MPFCTACGSAIAATWPRACSCGHTAYRNPTPVAVLLLPTPDGLVTIRRDIDPGRGKLALPGGFIEYGESWQEAAARECAEEAGIQVDPGSIGLFDTVSAPDSTVLIFGLAAGLDAVPESVVTAESSGVVILGKAEELAFPLHIDVVRRYFASVVD